MASTAPWQQSQALRRDPDAVARILLGEVAWLGREALTANDNIPGVQRPWTRREDEMLIAFGRCMGDGYAFVAHHDLGRTEQDGRDRIEYLRRHRPAFVRFVEQIEERSDKELGL